MSDSVRAFNDSQAAGAVLASLPRSFAPASTRRGALVVVEGSRDWPGRTLDALEEGAVAVVVIDPVPPAATTAASKRRADTSFSASDVMSVIRKHPVTPVLLSRRWSANPVVTQAAQLFRSALTEHSRVECRAVVATGAPLEAALVDQLGLLRRLIGEPGAVEVLARSEHGYAATCRADEHRVDLDVVCTGAQPSGLTVRLLTDDGSVAVRIPSDQLNARPAELVRTNAEGALLAPSIYEPALRATWRRARDLLAVGSPPEDLEEYAADLAGARTALVTT